MGSTTYMVNQTLTLETDQCSCLSHLNEIKSNPDLPGPSSHHPLALQQLSFFTELVVLSPTPVWPRPHPSSKRLLLTSPMLSWPANSLNNFPPSLLLTPSDTVAHSSYVNCSHPRALCGTSLFPSSSRPALVTIEICSFQGLALVPVCILSSASRILTHANSPCAADTPTSSLRPDVSQGPAVREPTGCFWGLQSTSASPHSSLSVSPSPPSPASPHIP